MRTKSVRRLCPKAAIAAWFLVAPLLINAQERQIVPVVFPQAKQASSAFFVKQTVFPKDTSQFLVRFNVKLAKKSYANHAREEGKKPTELAFSGVFQVNILRDAKKAIKIKNGLVLDAATQDSLLARGCHESNNHVFIYQNSGKLYVLEKK